MRRIVTIGDHTATRAGGVVLTDDAVGVRHASFRTDLFYPWGPASLYQIAAHYSLGTDSAEAELAKMENSQ